MAYAFVDYEDKRDAEVNIHVIFNVITSPCF